MTLFEKNMPLQDEGMGARDFERLVNRELPKGVEVMFDEYAPDFIELSNIETSSALRHQGLGTEAMRLICRLADTHKVNLVLIPAGESGEEHHDMLEEWYGRFGFETTDVGTMYRHSSTPRL